MSLRTLLLTVALSVFITPAQAQQITFSTVALSGEQAPGTTAGISYTGFNPPGLNNAGQCVFFATLSGASASNAGIFLGAPGSVALLARKGSPAPAGAGVNYSNFGFETHAINTSGKGAFSCELTGTGVTFENDRGLWSGAPGSVALLAREGDPAPGTGAGVTYLDNNFSGTPAINAAGQCVFHAALTGPGVVTNTNQTGLWLGAPGSVALLMRGGDHAPGTPAGVNFLFPDGSPAINAAGQGSFSANLTGIGVTSDNDWGIWVGAPGNLTLLVRTGDPAPGMPAGNNFLDFADVSNVGIRPALNASGQCAFAGHVTGLGLDNSGLWVGAPGSVTLLARAGNPAPGAAAGVNYSSFETPTINASGQSAFHARVQGSGITAPNDTGFWVGTPGSVAKVALEGEAAPGAGTGTLFGDQGGGEFAFNDRGEVAFVTSLTGPNVTSANDSSLWFSNAARNLTLIAREGSPLEVSPGVTRVVSGALRFAGNFRGGSGDEDGRPNGFNDQSQIAFSASFTDGSSGIFIATLPGSTPTPSQLLNIATRLRVQTGENVLIGGFIITGTDAKKVIIRAIGPSLSSFFSNFLANPTLELFQGNTTLDTNDDWIERRAEIEATGLQPSNDFESAIVRTLTPGAYTAIVRGEGNTAGIGLVEVYDLDQATNSKLANIATRGFVETGNDVMIGGLIVGPAGGANAKVVVRAIGPTLANFQINGALQDPTLDLVNASGAVIRSNNNWRQGSQEAELIALGLQPGDNRESALVETVGPGNYTAIVRGVGNTTGVALVEVYDVQ
jgi:hypothetical protein